MTNDGDMYLDGFTRNNHSQIGYFILCLNAGLFLAYMKGLTMLTIVTQCLVR